MADLPSSSDTVVATSGVSKRSPLDGADSPAVPQVVPDVIEKVIRVLREPGVALGMSVAGGTGALPPDTRDQGIFITRVADDGPSSLAGLRAGDRLLSVNGRSVAGMDHQSVVGLLKDAGTSVCLFVSREVVALTDNEAILVTLERDENGLGFTIAGGHGSTPYRGNDQSIYISRITECGAADRDGRLRVGDKLISVNGIDITVAPHDQAVALLTGIRGEISLVVSRDQHGDVTPPPQPVSNQSGAMAVTWPTTPLVTPDTTDLSVIVQPPTPNYAALELPSNEHQQPPPSVVRDVTDVAMDVGMDSAAAADVVSDPVDDVGEPAEIAQPESEPIAPDLIDFNETMTSRDDVITASSDTAAAVDISLEARGMMLLGQYDEEDFCIDDDDDEGLWAAGGITAVSSGVTRSSPMSSDVRHTIEHAMLETLRLL